MKNTPKSTVKNSHKKAQEAQKFNWFFLLLFLFFLCIFVASSAFAYSGGDGSLLNPYQIADANNLLQLAANADDYDKFFILTADINLAGYDFNDAVIAPGDEYSPAFYGSFDGACHKISNLTINAGENAYYLGLFGHTYLTGIYIYPDGDYYWSEIKNLTLENINIDSNLDGAIIGNLIGYNYEVPITNCHSTGIINCTNSFKYAAFTLGGLVGDNSGNISNCSSEGNIFITSNLYIHGVIQVGGLLGTNDDATVSDSRSGCNIICNISSDDYFGGGFVRVGGLVGYNVGNYQDSFINNCYSTGVVSLNNYRCHIYIGGLVGDNDSQISINKCFSTSPVSVTGDGNNIIGGLVGQNGPYCTISDCYSTGPVTGPVGPADYYYGLGGLVGYNGGILATIRNCYSIGEVNPLGGSEYVGGLVGAQYEGSIINSYFLETSGPANGLGAPLTDAQMRQQASFVGWDFVNVWWLIENITYPKLNWQRKLPSGPCVPAGPDDGGIYSPDYNLDHFIDFFDFAIFANAWLTENPFISLDGDSYVDINDLKIFCDYWLTYTNNIGY